MPHPPASTRSRRTAAAALVLAAGISLVAGCSADDAADTTTAADTAAPDTPAADTSAADTPAAAPSSSTEASAPAAAPTSSSPSTPAEAASETVPVTEGEMFIRLAEDSFSPGSYTFEVVNQGRMAHDFVVERDGEDVAGTELLRPGESTTLTVTLDAGDYVLYCSVDSHRAAGMETPITVRA